MKVISYKGYRGRVDFDDEDGIFVGRIGGINDTVGFRAETVDGIEAAFREAVDEYLADVAGTNRSPASPRAVLRMPPDLHAKVTLAAQRCGKDVDQWAEDALRDAASRA